MGEKQPNKRFKNFRRRYTQQINFIIKTLFGLLAAQLISSLNLEYFESSLYDLRLKTKSKLGLSQIKDPKIVLVIINSKTVEKYGGYPTYKDHALFLQKLKNYDPKYVLYDLKMTTDNTPEIEGPLTDQLAFKDQALRFKNFHVLTQDLEMKGEHDRLKLAEPLSELNLSPAPRTSDNTLYAKDGVSRRLMVSYQDQSTLQALVAADYNPKIQNLTEVRGQFDVFDSKNTYIHYHDSSQFKKYTFEDIVNKNFPDDTFKGKVVLIGYDTGRSPKDYMATPLAHQAEDYPTKTEVQANIIQTLIDNNAPLRMPKTMNLIITALISLLTVYVTLALKPGRGLFILLSTILSLSFTAMTLFILFGWWVDLAHPLLAVFLCYYFFIPYRLIKENRRSWEYYQKNKLLKQVEELKTNFISMMSHDLKTPLARIIGMTEVIHKDPQQLSSNQRDALDTIRSSSDDLLKFINSILQYGQIETQGVELHKQSKDINQLLSEVIKKHEFLARVKKIKIIQELEPLFPVAVDPELIKQVFSNLLENAIKYSPDDSTVWVRSREDGDKVLIEFKDQGIGIPTVDLPNIFMKFFRTSNVKTSTIKGSGLGLYLAQYFVQLHKGQITVQSEPEKGSQFTVELFLNN